MSNTVWTFTNQRELNKSQFVDYVERKVFRTIRKYSMLPKDKIITLKRSSCLNTLVLRKILGKKFKVSWDAKPNLSSDNLSQVAEDIFKNILKGDYTGPKPDNAPTLRNSGCAELPKPLYFLSDKEIGLYARLTNIKGTKRKQDKKIQILFEKFLKKNQDLELNIVKALSQLS